MKRQEKNSIIDLEQCDLEPGETDLGHLILHFSQNVGDDVRELIERTAKKCNPDIFLKNIKILRKTYEEEFEDLEIKEALSRQNGKRVFRCSYPLKPE